MAVDPDRVGLDSAVDPDVDCDPLLHGPTLNSMTLGGMARAVGILVDDSTVTIWLAA